MKASDITSCPWVFHTSSSISLSPISKRSNRTSLGRELGKLRIRFSLNSREVKFSRLKEIANIKKVVASIILVIYHPKSSGKSVSDMSFSPSTDKFFKRVMPCGSLKVRRGKKLASIEERLGKARLGILTDDKEIKRKSRNGSRGTTNVPRDRIRRKVHDLKSLTSLDVLRNVRDIWKRGQQGMRRCTGGTKSTNNFLGK